MTSNRAGNGVGFSYPRPPLDICPCSRPYARVVRFMNHRVNLLATLAGMARGQSILVRMASKGDKTRIVGAANNARTRIRIDMHPSENTIVVVSLGPQRKRAERHASLGSRSGCFQNWNKK